jgi:glucose/arabinose dehydrogenase
MRTLWPVQTRLPLILLLAATAILGTSCYSFRPSSGGGQTKAVLPRKIDPRDVALPRGYQIEPVATGLTFPTAVAFDPQGRVFVVEAGYSYGEKWTAPRLLRVEPDGTLITIATGITNGPWTGLAIVGQDFFVVEGGDAGGRILKITPAGEITGILDGLPGMGDHHSNGPIFGDDGWLLFAQGTASNSGVIGEDSAKFGWLHRRPEFHDTPGADIVLAGRNFETGNPLRPKSTEKVLTGAFLPFGTPSAAGQVIRGQLPCSGSVMRVRPDGSQLELVAWGFRNPFGMAFAPDGGLFVTENAYDDRGSRPVWGAPDVLWRVTPGQWYGWPDFCAGAPLTDPQFKPLGKPQPGFLLAKHPNPPPQPVARLGVHAAACGLDFSRSSRFGYVGQAFIALFGDQAPDVGKVLHPVGFKVVRVNVRTGEIEPFVENKGRISAPASRLKHGGIERPVSVKFNPTGDALYMVDFGVMTMSAKGPEPRARTGVLWKVSRSGPVATGR